MMLACRQLSNDIPHHVDISKRHLELRRALQWHHQQAAFWEVADRRTRNRYIAAGAVVAAGLGATILIAKANSKQPVEDTNPMLDAARSLVDGVMTSISEITTLAETACSEVFSHNVASE